MCLRNKYIESHLFTSDVFLSSLTLFFCYHLINSFISCWSVFIDSLHRCMYVPPIIVCARPGIWQGRSGAKVKSRGTIPLLPHVHLLSLTKTKLQIMGNTAATSSPSVMYRMRDSAGLNPAPHTHHADAQPNIPPFLLIYTYMR